MRMKYFASDLWKMLNSEDHDARQQANQKWKKASDDYSNYFDTIKNKLSKIFISLYYRYDGFHDAPIKNICIENVKYNRCNIQIAIELGGKPYVLTYGGVQGYKLYVPVDRYYWLGGVMSWGYGEFELTDDCLWNHRILCEVGCEFDILCKKISLKKL